jgi:ABC-2 type transport system permease protein
MGFLDQQAANPWRVSATTTWPRAILQCYFFVLLGSAITGGQSRAFAFEGSVVLILSLPTCISISAVPMSDKWMGTFNRIRLGRMPVVTVITLRAVPWLVEAFIMVLLSTFAVGALTDQVPLALKLMALAPLLMLMAVTSAAAGLAVASFAVGRSADVLLGNALMYLIIAAGGIIVPPGRLPWLDAVGQFLPLRNGLLAVRALIDGRPWAAHLLAELGVGAGWAVLAIIGYSYHIVQARRKGLDAFA